MQDPFPDENENLQENIMSLPKSYDDFVYHRSRFVDGNSPKCIYFPSRFVMFKLMRACIEVYACEDLWFKHCHHK